MVLDRLKTAYQRGGTGEVVRGARRRLARVIYPGPFPSTKRPNQAGTNAVRPAAPSQSASVAARPSPLDVDLPTALAWFESRRPIYEKLVDAVRPHVDPAGVVFDIGANVGYFTTMLAECLSFTGEAHLFEPVPNLVTLCRENLAGAPFTTHIYDFALGDEDETVDLYVSHRGNLGWNTMVGGRRTPDMTKITISVRRFDEAGISAVPNFIKIDVEGAEHKVLRGLLPALREWPRRPIILCEIGWGGGHPDWNLELIAFSELADLGYRAVSLDNEPVDVAALTRTTDVIFLPS